MKLLSPAKNLRRYPLQLGLLSLLAVVLIGCSIKLISDYDEVFDRSVTDLQKSVEIFLIKMAAAAGSRQGDYNNNKSFYEETGGTLNAILLRAESRPKNELMVQHIIELEKNIENLRKLHEGGGSAGLTKPVIQSARSALNTQFKAILTLELAKKRGT